MAPTFAPDYTLAGRYRISRLLGVGRTAEVYLAEDISLQRNVVVKVLLPDLAAHESIRRAFRDHIVRAATLSHPHLARVYDGGQEHGAIFMISEYLSGGSLEDALRAGRRLSVDDGARLGRDAGSALAYAHEQGFVLGALSPSKILFDDEGHLRLSDVALAGLAVGYRERMSLDDARYLSPEQAVGDPAGPESDVYALALILFEAVTGSAAYEGTTPEAILRARLTAPLPVRLELGTLDMVLAQAALPDPRLRLDAEQFSQRLGAVVSDAAPLVLRRGGGQAPLLAGFSPSEPAWIDRLSSAISRADRRRERGRERGRLPAGRSRYWRRRQRTAHPRGAHPALRSRALRPAASAGSTTGLSLRGPCAGRDRPRRRRHLEGRRVHEEPHRTDVDGPQSHPSAERGGE
jgi:serine/threonine protein kinase